MTEWPVFEQANLSLVTHFEFQATRLLYRLAGQAVGSELEIDYAHLPNHWYASSFVRRSFRNFGLLALVSGAAQAGWTYWQNMGSYVPVAVLAAVGIACLVMQLLSRSKITVLKVPQGAVWVLKDDVHDEILAELKRRRRLRLRDLYIAGQPRRLLSAPPRR